MSLQASITTDKLSPEHIVVNGRELLFTKIKAGDAEGYTVYDFDTSVRSWVCVCPIPQRTKEEAARAAEEILSDPYKHAMCVMLQAKKAFDEVNAQKAELQPIERFLDDLAGRLEKRMTARTKQGL